MVNSNTVERFVKPAVGARITVTTRYPNKYYFSKSEWDDRTYVGTVLADEKWTPDANFRLFTGNPAFPVSMFALGNVHELKYMDGTVARKEAIEAANSWVVKGSKGEDYIVTKSNGKCRCTCPGFTFRNKCKHSEGK